MEKLTLANNHEIHTFIDAEENNRYATTVTDTIKHITTFTVWNDTEAEALKSHEELLGAQLHPLQARFHKAGLKKGDRFTLVKYNDFGFPVAIMATLNRVEYHPYAQYDDNATVVYVPQGKRNPRFVHLHNEPFIVYGDWRPVPDEVVYSITHPREGVEARTARYTCFDDRYMDDIKAAMSDYLVAWDRRTPNEQHDLARAKAAKPLPFIPREIIPGITIAKDEENGLFADLDMPTFEELFVAPEGSPEHKLLRSLRRAAISAGLHLEDDDGGTCNFDTPVLHYVEYGLTHDEADAVIKSAGLSFTDWKGAMKIDGITSGQGNRRTAMAEAFASQLKADGIPSSVYYQID